MQTDHLKFSTCSVPNSKLHFIYQDTSFIYRFLYVFVIKNSIFMNRLLANRSDGMEDHILLDTLSGLGFKSNGKSATILVISTNSSEIRSHYNMKLNHRWDWLHIAWSLIISAVHFVIILFTQYQCELTSRHT